MSKFWVHIIDFYYLYTNKKQVLQLSSYLGIIDNNINIPENLPFIEIKKGATQYTAKFKIENIDEATREQLDDWYAQQISDLTANGWNKRDLRVNEKALGTVLNQYILSKPKGGKSSLDNIVSISSAYNTENKSYTVSISPSEH
jgi:hypothetical protein